MQTKIQAALELLKQPSTIKGLIGLAGLAGWVISPEQYQTAIAGIGALYFLIAIFWQKS
jgi:hypothetical protein